MKLLKILPMGIALGAAMLLALVGAQLVSAAGTVTVCDEAHLTTALAGGGLVQFNCGGPATISVSAVKNIAANTLVDGANNGSPLTLTAASGNALFQVSSGAALTLSHVTVYGVNNPNGAVFVQSGSLLVTSSQFITNLNIAILDYGPATIVNTVFSGNTGGSPIRAAASGALDIRNSRFVSNTVGAVLNTGSGAVVIRDSQFNSNGAVPFIYGALDMDASGPSVGPLTVTNSSFYSNFGSGIYVNQGRLYMSNTLVYNNHAPYAGMEFDYPAATQILGSTIHDNLGGGIHVNGGSNAGFLVANSQILNNNAATSLGGILAGTTVFTLSQSTIAGNRTIFNNNSGGLDTGASAYITGSTISGNSGPQAGGFYLGNAGAISYTPVDVVANSKILNNTATTYDGGGGHVSVSVNIFDSEFSGNADTAFGGNGGGLVIFAPGTPVTIARSLFYNNSVTSTNGNGAGLYVGANLSLINSTIYSNSAATNGGLYVQFTAALTNVTIVSNTATGNFAQSGNLQNAGLAGATSVFNTIIAGGSANNCGGNVILSLGHNLGTDGSRMLTGTADLSGTVALLDPFQNNGGPTRTLMPSPVSPAVNAGANAGCPADDQRHIARPLHAVCDIGAVESPYTILKLFLPVIVR